MVQTDSAKVRICKREEQKCARECHRTHANTTLGKFPYGVPLENLLSRRARAEYPARINAGAGEGI
jgi:hypothetical protein